MKVFLSHSSADKPLARRLARDLRARHVDVWLDEWELRVGEKFEQRIEQGLDEVDFVIVLLTKASVASEWVNREWRRKVQHEAQTNRVAVIPVRGEICEIPDFLAQRSHADISGGSYPMGFRRLLRILRHYSDGADIEIPEDTTERQDSPEMLPIVTPLAIEVAHDLIPLFEPEDTSRALKELAPRTRMELQEEFGFPFPGIRIRGNEADMPPGTAMILIEEIPEAWLQVTEADAAQQLFSTLQAVVRRMPGLFLDIDTTERLVNALEPADRELFDQVVPNVVSWFGLTNVLQRLVDEDISIGDLPRILRALSQQSPAVSDLAMVAEDVRAALNEQITAAFAGGDASLQAVLLDPAVEQQIADGIEHSAAGSFIRLPPRLTDDLLAALDAALESLGPRASGVPVLVTSSIVRPFVRRLVSARFPALAVLSTREVAPGTAVTALAHVRIDRR